MTLACEPTGHRRKVVDELALQAGIELACAQPLLVHRARESEDFTRDKSNDKDALPIPNVIVRPPVVAAEVAAGGCPDTRGS